MCQHLDLILLAFFPNNSAAFCGFHSVPGRPSLLVPPPSVPVRSRTRRPNRPIADTAPSSQPIILKHLRVATSHATLRSLLFFVLSSGLGLWKLRPSLRHYCDAGVFRCMLLPLSSACHRAPRRATPRLLALLPRRNRPPAARPLVHGDE